MGGEREDIIEAQRPLIVAGKTMSVEVEGGDSDSPQIIRIHEDKGEVHLHVDEEGLKVVIPSAAWWKAWERLRNPLRGEIEIFTFGDRKNNTFLHVGIYYEGDGKGNIFMKAEMIIMKLDASHPTLAKLAKFSESR